MISKPDSALVIVGHGATRNPDSSAPTRAHAGRIRQMGVFKEVACCFWKEEPPMRHALDLVKSAEVYVVPNFISEGYFTQRVIPRELGLSGPVTQRAGRVVKYCEPAGSHPMVTEILLRRAREVASGVPEAETSLVLVAHGTGLDDNSARAARREAEAIGALGLYAEVHSAYMEQEPSIANWLKFTAQPNVVVVPFFIADGLHSYEDIPALLGIIRAEAAAPGGGAGVFRKNPHHLHGRNLYYASAIGTEPHFAEVILDQVAQFDRKNL